MADMDNFSEINQNFDTIKTLLNSIRAQGILNTSDVDKLLTGINSKLEKINTEEDIDLIKIFLSELKQNLDERHSMLISKFGAIESLFSNLLKNSSEMPKSAEIKELFDIVATNLSVFSREVVSQKDSLSDIALKLDALRSDDSQKKDIIKNIAILRSDLERLSNGFDSIVISLNDNFKTIIKTITTIDKTEHLDKFADDLNNIEMSSNTILSALQMLDKKTESIEAIVNNLTTKEDLASTNHRLFELNVQGKEISDVVTELSSKYTKIDNLTEKIDASVNIIASLKSMMAEADETKVAKFLEELKLLEQRIDTISSETKFEELKNSLEIILKEIADKTSILDTSLQDSNKDLDKIYSLINSLNIDIKFTSLSKSIDDMELSVKNSIQEVTQQLVSLQDINVKRILNDISSDAEALNAKLNETQSNLLTICETNFNSVIEGVLEVRKLISQVDENSVSANNAIFSSITDRLSAFENSFKSFYELQEKNFSSSSKYLNEQIDSIKDVSNLLDYKMDSSIVGFESIKQGFDALKGSVDDILALNFVNTVKDLRIDLYASKQDLETSFENANNMLAEKITEDLYGKYELLISKLDVIDEGFKKVQSSSLTEMKGILEKISSSIVDVLSYVSEQNSTNNDQLDSKFEKIASFLKENNLEYIETVRDVVDVIRIQVDNNLKSLEARYIEDFNSVKEDFAEKADDIKKELKYSYSKLLEIQNSYDEIKQIVNSNSVQTDEKYAEIINATSSAQADFTTKLESIKTNLLDKISEFKQDLALKDADKVSEFKFTVENFCRKNTNEIQAILEVLKSQNEQFSQKNEDFHQDFSGKIFENLCSIKVLIDSIKEDQNVKKEEQLKNLSHRTDDVKASIVSSQKEMLDILDRKTTELSTSLEDIKNNITDSCDKTNIETVNKANEMLASIDSLKNILVRIDDNIDGDLTRQLSIIESNFEALVSQVSILFDKSDCVLTNKISTEFELLSQTIQTSVSTKLEDYKIIIENVFDKLQEKASQNSKNLQVQINDFNEIIKRNWEEQAVQNQVCIKDLSTELKTILDENIKLTAADYVALKNKLNEFSKNIEINNQYLTQELSAKIDDIVKYLDSVIEIQAQELDSKYDSLCEKNSETAELIKKSIDELFVKTNEHTNIVRTATADISAVAQMSANNNNLLEGLIVTNNDKFAQISGMHASAQEFLERIENTSLNTTGLVETLKTNLASLSQSIVANTEQLHDANNVVSEKFANLNLLVTESSSKQQEEFNKSFDNILNLLNSQKQQFEFLQVQLSQLIKKEVETVSSNIEKETDVIIAELIEQFDLLKKSNKDDIVNLTSQIEGIISSQIYNNIEDLKSYLDIKTDNSVLSMKLDTLKVEMTDSLSEIINNMSKLLDVNIFISAIGDFKVANELLINSSLENLNKRLENFVNDNNVSIEEKFTLFNKKFIDTVVDKFEEVKLLSSQYNSASDVIQKTLDVILQDFDYIKVSMLEKFDLLMLQIKENFVTANNEIHVLNKNIETTNNEVRTLSESFENLRSQISNKSFDEAFQASIYKQVSNLEDLIKEQFTYIEDINELCVNNLPDVTEINTLIKHSILESINKFSDKLEDNNVELQLEALKSDIITQILNVFNQISFVTEQEEILDFVQEKHDELISVLSHIVTNTSDNIDSIKNEIKNINEKITSIISSEGDVDYIYSLHDLESDIANLRLVLNEMKENGHGKELAELIDSTNNIYKLVEAVPNKSDFEAMAEDIVSISTRTNKLILASDESYKTLHDNLQDFKLVINDLDERTRNFAEDSGMNRIDSKLNSINSMMLNGAKTNQIFNQVFEYLAEWVDNAGVQINSISDKIETLDEIGQIKDMLIDLKAGAEDNTESEELVEALGSVFEKQAKRISALETKIDRVIVETTINNQNNKLDISPLEETFNKFLVAMDEKISAQQAKINSLEAKLEDMTQLLEDKDTASLTKKVGGMDRQIAKLNKSIEKIASHVVEK